jgi:hypothetical protein
VTAKFCGNCARASCDQAGLVEVCDEWSDTDDETSLGIWWTVALFYSLKRMAKRDEDSHIERTLDDE